MNIDEAAKNMGVDREFYLELIGDFLVTAMDDLKKMDAAIETGNADGLNEAAHSVKGAAWSLYFMEVADIAEDIEKKVLDGKVNELREPVRLLKSKIEDLHTLSE